MSCPICRRSSCTVSFHSHYEQERFEQRQNMSDDVDDLRCEAQCYGEELTELKVEIDVLRAELDECQDQLSVAGERIEELENDLCHAIGVSPDPI
jgi:uncharacterized coiled-coil DUF342 family protein